MLPIGNYSGVKWAWMQNSPASMATLPTLLPSGGKSLRREWRRRSRYAARARMCLLLVDSHLALTEGVLPYLSTKTIATPGASLTLLIHGHFTVGAEPAPLADLDTVMTFDTALTHQRLYPAIDPVWSSSTLLATDQVEPQHRQVAQQARRLLRRYIDLHDAYERTGADAFWYIEDDPNLMRDIARARRV